MSDKIIQFPNTTRDISGWLSKAGAWMDRYRAKRELRAMSDRLLSDIGINRVDIDFVVDHGRLDRSARTEPLVIAAPVAELPLEQQAKAA